VFGRYRNAESFGPGAVRVACFYLSHLYAYVHIFHKLYSFSQWARLRILEMQHTRHDRRDVKWQFPYRGERVRGVSRIELERDERKDRGSAKRTYRSSTSASRASARSVFLRALRTRAARSGASSTRIVSSTDARPAMCARSTLTVPRA
jgi:hypothetical protein